MADKYILGQVITSVVIFVAVLVNYLLIRRESVKIRFAAVEAAERIEAKALFVAKQLEDKAELVSFKLKAENEE